MHDLETEERGICVLCCRLAAEGPDSLIANLKEWLYLFTRLWILLWSAVIAVVLGIVQVLTYIFSKPRQRWTSHISPVRVERVSPVANGTPTENMVLHEANTTVDLLCADLTWQRGDPESKWRALEEAMQIRNGYCKALDTRIEHRERLQQMHADLQERESHLQWLADNGKAGERELLHLDQVREERRNLGLRIHAEQNLW